MFGALAAALSVIIAGGGSAVSASGVRRHPYSIASVVRAAYGKQGDCKTE